MKPPNPTSGPKCPTCGTKLEGIGFPIQLEGRGFCPVGEIYVDYNAEIDKTKNRVDKDGNIIQYWIWKVGKANH